MDKSSAYRLADGYPLVVPEVNGDRARDAIATTRVVANPNCSTIPLSCVLKPLHDAAGLKRVRVSTYQAVSGAGAQRMERLRAEAPEEHDLEFDWTWEGDETDEEAKIRAETRKILELPELPLSATTVRVPGPRRTRTGGLGRAGETAPARARGVGASRGPERAPRRGADPGARRRRRRRCSSAASARIAPERARASSSSSPATTSSRAPHSTRSRSLSCCSTARARRRERPSCARSARELHASHRRVG